MLAEAGLPAGLAAALDDESGDVEIQAETDEALALTGKDVGTPILHFHPPEGMAFFGPVISRVPSEARPSSSGTTSSPSLVSRASPSSSAACASGRSCRRPVSAADEGVEEDWHGRQPAAGGRAGDSGMNSLRAALPEG